MRIFENLTVCLSDCGPGVLNRKTGQVEFRAATPPPKPTPAPRSAPPPPPTVEQQLAALAAEVYRAPAPRAATLQATDPPHDRLTPDDIYTYRRQQLQKRDFAVDTPSPAATGDLAGLAATIYQERARSCGMC